ncbi:MAG TPA: AMP-binding protein [Nocardioidaceae bacterium]|nr:AMP-binding protein [Nocardioidaceae bacterium]
MTGYDPTAYRDVFEKNFTYLAGFRRNVHRYAARPAMHDPRSGRTWSFADLGAEVDRLAAGLVAAGLAPGDVLVHQLLNGPEFAELYLATQVAGAVGAPINFRLAPGETAFILDDSRPRVYVYDTELTEPTRRALELAEHSSAVVVAVGDGSPLPGAIRFEELVQSGGDPPAVAQGAYTETTRLYTSGTTGMPKGVPLNSVAEVLTAHDVIMHFPLAPDDITLNMTPWFHRGGVHVGGPSTCFYLGAQTVPLRSFDADACLDLVERLGITYLAGAPTNLALLTAAQQKQARDLSSLHGIITMGSPLEREACLRYQKVLTPRIFNGYGTTEAFWNTFLRPGDLPEHAGSAGRACTDDDVAVVRLRDDGRLAGLDETVAQDNSEIGEVVVRSPKCAYTYYNSPDAATQKFHDGWLYIGDLATWDEHEYVTIVGRKDDMIISGGENVHPVQVEEALNEHPKVADSIVVGIPDEKWGQRIVAYVVRGDDTLDAAECDRHCREHPMLAAFKRPRGYRFVDALPLTATGKKVHYKALEQAVGEHADGLFAVP